MYDIYAHWHGGSVGCPWHVFDELHEQESVDPTQPFDDWRKGKKHSDITPVGWVGSAYQNEGNGVYIVVNRNTEEVIHFPAMAPHLIGDHHFFEGRGTPYRMEPRDLIRVLDI